MTEQGIYFVNLYSGTWTNGPGESATTLLEVINVVSGNNNYILQKFYGSKLYTRLCTNNSWDNWRSGASNPG